MFLGLLWCNFGFADELKAKILTLQCKYNDGSGNELIIIDWDKQKIMVTDELGVHEYIISNHKGAKFIPWQFNAYSKDRRIKRAQNPEISKTSKSYSIDVSLLYFNIWHIYHKQGNNAEVYHSQVFNLSIYEDKDNLVFMPKKEDLNFLNENEYRSIGKWEFIGDAFNGGTYLMNCNKI